MTRVIVAHPTTRTLLTATLRRLPYTLITAVTVLTVTAATDTLVRPITPALLERWGFGLDNLREGRFLQLLTSPFQAYRPYMVLTISASLLLFLGSCEYILGTRRAIIAFWSGHVAGYLGSFLLLWPFEAAGYGWAERMTRRPDVGASAAGFAVAGAVIPFLPAVTRRIAFAVLAAYLIVFLLLDRRVWDVEHLLAFPAGLALGIVFLRRRGGPWPSLVAWPRLSRRQRPAVAAWCVAVMGFINILSAFISPRRRMLEWLEENLPLAVAHAGRHLTLVLGFALILLALGLARAKRQAWLLTIAALAASGTLHLLKGGDVPEALLAFVLVAALLRWREAFIARTDPPSLRQGYTALAVLMVVLPLYGAAGFFILRYQYTEVYSVWAALKETGARLLFANAGEYAAETHRARWFLDSIPLLGWIGLAYGLALLLRGVLAPKPAATDLERARELLGEYGRSGTAYMTLWPGNAVFFGPDRASYVGYRLAAGVALALGDPIGPDERVRETIAAFDHFCHGQGWDHAFYAATPHALAAYEALGYRTLKVGEEALIPLPGLEFKGKDWQNVRSALNRAQRERVTFALYEGGSAPPAVREQLFAISEAWLRGKGLPEMGFTLGTAEDVDDPNVYLAVALDARGRVLGFLDWLPMYAASGWVIDLMRRQPDAFPGVMEFLIGSSLLAFKERGYRVASLAAAPLANADSGDEAESPIQRVLGFISERFDSFYHFQSLFAFKKKFQPRWEGVYLIYHSHAELPRISLAVLRAHMPELGPRVVAELVGSSVMGRLGVGGEERSPRMDPHRDGA